MGQGWKDQTEEQRAHVKMFLEIRPERPDRGGDSDCVAGKMLGLEQSKRKNKRLRPRLFCF